MSGVGAWVIAGLLSLVFIMIISLHEPKEPPMMYCKWYGEEQALDCKMEAMR